jgi:hypothetical protein
LASPVSNCSIRLQTSDIRLQNFLQSEVRSPKSEVRSQSTRADGDRRLSIQRGGSGENIRRNLATGATARHHVKARWNRLKGREIAGPAIDGRCTKKQRLVAYAKGQKRGFPPTRKYTKAACCGFPLRAGWNGSWSRVPVQGDIWDIWDVWDGMAGHNTLERFVSVRVGRVPGSCPTMRRRPKVSAWAERLARRSLKPERGTKRLTIA